MFGDCLIKRPLHLYATNVTGLGGSHRVKHLILMPWAERSFFLYLTLNSHTIYSCSACVVSDGFQTNCAHITFEWRPEPRLGRLNIGKETLQRLILNFTVFPLKALIATLYILNLCGLLTTRALNINQTSTSLEMYTRTCKTFKASKPIKYPSSKST